jgi:hypothetical protein
MSNKTATASSGIRTDTSGIQVRRVTFVLVCSGYVQEVHRDATLIGAAPPVETASPVALYFHINVRSREVKEETEFFPQHD